jgi:hypothetical protein
VRGGTAYRRATEQDYNNANADMMSPLAPFEYGTEVASGPIAEVKGWAEQDHADRNAPSAPDAPDAPDAPGSTGPGTISEITTDEAEQLLDELPSDTDDSRRYEYMRHAIQGKLDYGDPATVFVERGPDGKPVGAALVVDYDGDPEFDIPPYSLLDRVGALGGGAGTRLTHQAMEHALAGDRELMVDPIPTSQTYWVDRMGAKLIDPEAGSYYGWSTDEMRRILGRDAPSAPEPAASEVPAPELTAYQRRYLSEPGLINPADSHPDRVEGLRRLLAGEPMNELHLAELADWAEKRAATHESLNRTEYDRGSANEARTLRAIEQKMDAGLADLDRGSAAGVDTEAPGGFTDPVTIRDEVQRLQSTDFLTESEAIDRVARERGVSADQISSALLHVTYPGDTPPRAKRIKRDLVTRYNTRYRWTKASPGSRYEYLVDQGDDAAPGRRRVVMAGATEGPDANPMSADPADLVPAELTADELDRMHRYDDIMDGATGNLYGYGGYDPNTDMVQLSDSDTGEPLWLPRKQLVPRGHPAESDQPDAPEPSPASTNKHGVDLERIQPGAVVMANTPGQSQRKRIEVTSLDGDILHGRIQSVKSPGDYRSGNQVAYLDDVSSVVEDAPDATPPVSAPATVVEPQIWTGEDDTVPVPTVPPGTQTKGFADNGDGRFWVAPSSNSNPNGSITVGATQNVNVNSQIQADPRLPYGATVWTVRTGGKPGLRTPFAQDAFNEAESEYKRRYGKTPEQFLGDEVAYQVDEYEAVDSDAIENVADEYHVPWEQVAAAYRRGVSGTTADNTAGR